MASETRITNGSNQEIVERAGAVKDEVTSFYAGSNQEIVESDGYGRHGEAAAGRRKQSRDSRKLSARIVVHQTERPEAIKR